MCSSERSKAVLSGEKSYSGAPFIVYRSAKYVGVGERAFQSLTTYGRFYLFNPIINRIRRFLIIPVLHHLLPFIFILITGLPFLIVFIGLFILRKLRAYLIRKYYPNCTICEDLSPRSLNPEEAKTEGMITSIVWVKGHIDSNSLSSHLESRISSGSLSILNKLLRIRLTLKVWENVPSPLDISKHVVQAPTKFYDRLITDETRDCLNGGTGGKSDKSVLEKYVTSRVSEEMDKNLPPWQITLVPLPLSFGSGPANFRNNNRKNSRTCVVLRFHKLLLQRPEVVKMLVTSLGQVGEMEILDPKKDGAEFGILGGVQWISSEIGPQLPSIKMEDGCGFEESRGKELRIFKRKALLTLIFNEYNSALSDLKIWYGLKKKQYEFHSKLFVAKSVWLEFQKALKPLDKILSLQIWDHLKIHFLRGIQLFRAISFIPLVIFQSFLVSKNSNGFQRNERRTTRHVSWSKPVPINFLTEIQNKTENASEESILLVACSLALRDYYYENCIPNPGSVGISYSSTSPSSKSTNDNKLVDLPTQFFDIAGEINKANQVLQSYPKWKQMGLIYLEKWSSHLLPRPLAFLVFQKLSQRYSIDVNFIDMESPFPHLNIWGQSVDEFTCWKGSNSGASVSISVVKYAGSVRLSVMSPMKSVDSIISQRFSQNLNKIAEWVGVEKSRIPYSRKSSPNSSAAASPHQKRPRGSLFKSNSFSENQPEDTTKKFTRCNSFLAQ